MSAEVAISVIISTRNRAHYLPAALSSLAAQECGARFEVVVVDNASSDATPSVLAEWCRSDPRFRACHEPLPGLSRGKNAGIRMARAPLLLFTDDDVRVDPHWIEAYRDLFARRGDSVMLAGGPIVPIPHDLGRWPDWFQQPALADAGLLDHRAERALGRFEYVWGANIAASRRVFEEHGWWDESAGLRGDRRVTLQESASFEDTELQDRLRRAGVSTWFCPAAILHHRVERRTITPRRIMATAFARGRNQVWTQALPVWQQVERVPRQNAVVCLFRLATSLVTCAAWLLVFRVLKRPRGFEHARRAAFEAGRWLDSLRAGRRSLHWFRGAGRIAFPAQAALSRLAPDT